MEEIERAKQSAQNLFKVFQEEFYDKSTLNYKQNECSPTRRLINMKNTVVKHQTIERDEGIKDGKYQI
jgi:hypothetical protein